MFNGSFGGITFDSLGLTLTKVNIPLLPETRQIEEEIPGLDGTLDLQTEYGPRPIELTFFFSNTDEVSYQIALQNIAKTFNQRRGVQPLILDRMSGKRWLVKYNGNIPIERIATIGEFTVPFKAFFPFAESVTDSLTPLALGQGYTLGMGLRLGDVYTFSVKSSPKTFTVYHAGTHEARPIIRLTGTGKNITLANDMTQEAFTYNAALVAGDTLEIDCRAPNRSKTSHTIKVNGLNAFHNFSGLFPRLAEGENVFTITSENPNLTVEFLFRHTYLY